MTVDASAPLPTFPGYAPPFPSVLLRALGSCCVCAFVIGLEIDPGGSTLLVMAKALTDE